MPKKSKIKKNVCVLDKPLTLEELKKVSDAIDKSQAKLLRKRAEATLRKALKEVEKMKDPSVQDFGVVHITLTILCREIAHAESSVVLIWENAPLLKGTHVETSNEESAT